MPQVRWLEAVGSTQDVAHEAAAGGAPHGTAVAARVQTAGRGTRRRQWVSSEGGLWISVVCRPRDTPCLEAVSIRTALALATLLDRFLSPGARLQIKWPNDLLVDGRKAGGVLAEARWQGDALSWMVIGTGINVHNPLPSHAAPEATRLADYGVRQGPGELAPLVATVVAEASRGAGPLTAQEVRAFDARDWLRGRRVAEPRAGIASGITETGRLRLRTAESETVEILETITLAEPVV